MLKGAGKPQCSSRGRPGFRGTLWVASRVPIELAKLAKKYNLDAIHDTVHEMARDEARHGKAFKGLLDRYFGK